MRERGKPQRTFQVNIHVGEELYNELVAFAEKNERSFGWVGRLALREFFDRQAES